MKKLSGNEIRKIWIDFFKKRNHLFIDSQSLIPKNDPSLLWINSGIATLKDYFSGMKNPPSKRLVNCQKAIRTNDIFNVGITSRHHTFFEMLGNFSIGDYFKKEAIQFAYDLLIKEFQIEKSKLYFTVFKDDIEAYQSWINLGIEPNHILKNDKIHNFWDLGQGPCGPCTEIFYDRGLKYDPKNIGTKLFFDNLENDRYIEIWNIVFSQFNNDGNNNYSELKRKNIDTGAGLERLACISQNVPTNFDTDLFLNSMAVIAKNTKYQYDPNAYFNKTDHVQNEINHAYRIIVDHMRALVFAIADGANPSSKERGSILRKLIRRAMVMGQKLEITKPFLEDVCLAIIDKMKVFYSYLNDQTIRILKVINDEEKLFKKTLEKGYELFKSSIQDDSLDANIAFKLFDTFGFPEDLILELVKTKNIAFDHNKFNKLLKHHQEVSRSKEKIVAMNIQNNDLINFNITSDFDYHLSNLENVEIIGLFDKNFKEVKHLDDEGWVAFNRTIFYATSGGQKHDEGTIWINSNEYQVRDVIKAPNGQHLHFISEIKTPIKLNQKATLEINKEVRSLVTKNHSAEHLLQRALKTIISDNIKQEGAFKSSEKLTFDFSYEKKLTFNELIAVENKVNEYISSRTNVDVIYTTLEEAKKAGAIALFENVYRKINNKLRLIKMGNITSELCGGTHVKNLLEIENFLIIKYYLLGSNSYRIEAITSNKTVNSYLNSHISTIKNEITKMSQDLKKQNIDNLSFNKLINDLNFEVTRKNYHDLTSVFEKIKNLYIEIINKNKKAKVENEFKDILNEWKQSSINQSVSIKLFENKDPKVIQQVLSQLTNQFPETIFIAFIRSNNRIQYFCSINPNNKNLSKITAIDIIKKINKILDGFGGGKNNFAQGGSNNSKNLELALKQLKEKNIF